MTDSRSHGPTLAQKNRVYSEDDLPEFTPLPWTLNQIRAAIPERLFVRHNGKAFVYLARDLAMAAMMWWFGTLLDPFCKRPLVIRNLGPVGAEILRWSGWLFYWWFQGLIFTGLWVVGHECGHGAFSSNKRISDSIGFILHTALFTPFFSWKISHHRHHSNHASMERDEVYVPLIRSDLGIPKEEDGHEIDYEDYFGDTPIFTLLMLIRQQLFAFPAYLLFNVSGQKSYPKWTNHFDPNSILFNPSQRNAVILSNIGIASMIAALKWALSIWGSAVVIKFYVIPWLCVNHWFLMATYLHHTDPQLPHYRNTQWNFQRGAASTVDRPFLGWQGRFFMHDVSHFHVVHHFFPMMPWYHGEEATTYLKEFLGNQYHYDETPIFRALWRSYNDCQFVEDEGDVLFYRNKKGQAAVRPAAAYRGGVLKKIHE
ncbi:fatty acid desaturase-domain-containing protein [Sparassis latifolia]